MLFYMDPYGDEDRFSLIDQIKDEDEGNRKRTRILFDRAEKRVLLYQETFCCGHNRDGSVSFSVDVAKQMFPAHAEKIAELSK